MTVKFLFRLCRINPRLPLGRFVVRVYIFDVKELALRDSPPESHLVRSLLGNVSWRYFEKSWAPQWDRILMMQ